VIATKEIKIGVRAAIAIAMLAAAFALPASASAASCSQSDPTAAQYCSEEVVVHEETTSSAEPSSEVEAATASSGSLPFTGLDLAALIAAAAVLTGTGLALRRISNSGSHKA
jgi:hypothetical protein